jgi:hypothetical protein
MPSESFRLSRFDTSRSLLASSLAYDSLLESPLNEPSRTGFQEETPKSGNDSIPGHELTMHRWSPTNYAHDLALFVHERLGIFDIRWLVIFHGIQSALQVNCSKVESRLTQHLTLFQIWPRFPRKSGRPTTEQLGNSYSGQHIPNG